MAQSDNTSNPKQKESHTHSEGTKLNHSMSINLKWMHITSCLESPSPAIIFIF